MLAILKSHSRLPKLPSQIVHILDTNNVDLLTNWLESHRVSYPIVFEILFRDADKLLAVVQKYRTPEASWLLDALDSKAVKCARQLEFLGSQCTRSQLTLASRRCLITHFSDSSLIQLLEPWTRSDWAWAIQAGTAISIWTRRGCRFDPSIEPTLNNELAGDYLAFMSATACDHLETQIVEPARRRVYLGSTLIAFAALEMHIDRLYWLASRLNYSLGSGLRRVDLPKVAVEYFETYANPKMFRRLDVEQVERFRTQFPMFEPDAQLVATLIYRGHSITALSLLETFPSLRMHRQQLDQYVSALKPTQCPELLSWLQTHFDANCWSQLSLNNRKLMTTVFELYDWYIQYWPVLVDLDIIDPRFLRRAWLEGRVVASADWLPMLGLEIASQCSTAELMWVCLTQAPRLDFSLIDMAIPGLANFTTQQLESALVSWSDTRNHTQDYTAIWTRLRSLPNWTLKLSYQTLLGAVQADQLEVADRIWSTDGVQLVQWLDSWPTENRPILGHCGPLAGDNIKLLAELRQVFNEVDLWMLNWLGRRLNLIQHICGLDPSSWCQDRVDCLRGLLGYWPSSARSALAQVQLG